MDAQRTCSHRAGRVGGHPPAGLTMAASVLAATSLAGFVAVAASRCQRHADGPRERRHAHLGALLHSPGRGTGEDGESQASTR